MWKWVVLTVAVIFGVVILMDFNTGPTALKEGDSPDKTDTMSEQGHISIGDLVDARVECALRDPNYYNDVLLPATGMSMSDVVDWASGGIDIDIVRALARALAMVNDDYEVTPSRIRNLNRELLEYGCPEVTP